MARPPFDPLATDEYLPGRPVAVPLRDGPIVFGHVRGAAHRDAQRLDLSLTGVWFFGRRRGALRVLPAAPDFRGLVEARVVESVSATERLLTGDLGRSRAGLAGREVPYGQCPSCGLTAGPRDGFCARCGQALRIAPPLAECQHPLEWPDGQAFCPCCGGARGTEEWLESQKGRTVDLTLRHGGRRWLRVRGVWVGSTLHHHGRDGCVADVQVMVMPEAAAEAHGVAVAPLAGPVLVEVRARLDAPTPSDVGDAPGRHAPGVLSLAGVMLHPRCSGCARECRHGLGPFCIWCGHRVLLAVPPGVTGTEGRRNRRAAHPAQQRTTRTVTGVWAAHPGQGRGRRRGRQFTGLEWHPCGQRTPTRGRHCAHCGGQRLAGDELSVAGRVYSGA